MNASSFHNMSHSIRLPPPGRLPWNHHCTGHTFQYKSHNILCISFVFHICLLWLSVRISNTVSPYRARACVLFTHRGYFMLCISSSLAFALGNHSLSTGTLPLVYKYTLVPPINNSETQHNNTKPSLPRHNCPLIPGPITHVLIFVKSDNISMLTYAWSILLSGIPIHQSLITQSIIPRKC